MRYHPFLCLLGILIHSVDSTAEVPNFSSKPICATWLSEFDWHRDREALTTERWAPARFSDPHLHDPKKFRYVVHAVDGSKFFEKLKSFHDRRFRPDDLICATVVDQKVTTTFRPFGYILEIPPENVVATHYRDLGIFNDWSLRTAEDRRHTLGSENISIEDYRRRLFTQTGVQPPEEILEHSLVSISLIDEFANEVVLDKIGLHGRMPKVIGIFYNRDAANKTFIKFGISLSEAKKFAELAGLPFVELNP